jgi:chromosome segregation ATPase
MPRAGWAVAGLLALAGCANQPCDPHADRSIFQVGGCVMGGGYQQRVDVLQAQINQAEAEQAATERNLAAARSRRDSLAVEQAQLRTELAAERTRSARMNREIAALRDRRGADRERVDALEARITQLRAEQDQLRDQMPGETTRRRHEELASQRRTLERSLAEVNRSVQRE